MKTIEEMGHQICFMQQEKEELPCAPDWVEAVIGNGFFQFHPIDQFKNLRYIQLTSVGMDRVPMDYIKDHGIEIHNAKGVYAVPMAEFAFAGVLQLMKKSNFFAENQKAHKWVKTRDLIELAGKTVCIVGCGDVGQECAKRFTAFGCHVIGVNRTEKENPFFETVYSLDQLTDVIGQADIVVVSIALTQETRHLFDKNVLGKMKDSAILVNLARGAIVDTEALIQRLPKLYGAVLDVFEEEPLNENSPLWDRENVILTPHNSFVGDGNAERMGKVIIDNIRGV